MAQELSMNVNVSSNKRIPEIVQQLKRLTAGDFTQTSLPVDENNELVDVSRAVNELAEVMARAHHQLRRRERRLEALLDILLKYTILDFSERAPVEADGDEVDALAAGLNALGEEVIDHMERLRDSETQIQTIFKNAPDAIVVIDSSDVIVQWNPAATRIFGWTHEELAGKCLHETLVPHAYRERHVAGMRHFLKTLEGPILNRTIELPALCKNNAEIPVELTISPAKLNERYLFIAFMRDITDRKRAEEEILQLNATLEQRVSERTSQLNLSEQKYRHLFENNPIPLWVLDLETLHFLDVNDSAIKHYGYSREEFLSMTSLDLRPEDERERYVDLNRSMKGTQNTGVWKHRKKDGTVIFTEVIAHEFIFEERSARLVLAHDVTKETIARKDLEHSEARFRRVFDSKMTGFFFWEEDGGITQANDLFLEMLGYTRSDLEEGALNLNRITPPEYTAIQAQAMQQIRLSGVCEPFEKEYIRKDGTLLPVLIGAANIEDGPVISGVTCVMDITQRKKMEREIMALNNDLESRIQERTRALQEANKELESFSYSVSHDLRAPLRAIHGYSQMLTEDYGNNLDTEGVRLLEAVKLNARRMGQLVDDLLSFARMGRRSLRVTSVNLNRIVDDVLNDLKPGNDHRVSIRLLRLGIAEADESLLRQAFENLIANAIKYSAKEAHPQIEIGSEMMEGETVYYVKDNGAGFDMAYYKKLFGVFQRLHEQEEFEGTGVGLAIVHRIIQRHGGRIWAEGKVGEGAVFYFTLGSLDGLS